MRLFFALWPDAALRRKFAELARTTWTGCGGRLVPPRNLHLTLAFLGEVDARRLDTLCRIGASLRAAPFDLAFDGVGFFRRSGIVHATVSAVPAALDELEAALRSTLAAQGFRTESRPFLPHVTLVRDARSAPAVEVQGPYAMWQVRHIVLAESCSTREGQVYRAVRQFMLAP
jgi:2'-5' RNA ligase